MSRKTFQRLSLDARRCNLLEATLDCVATYGLDGATARRIADSADVTAGLIRHYFGSKDDMILAAYAYLVGQLTSQAAEAAAESGGEPSRRLAHFIVANVTTPNLSDRKVSLWATFIGRIRVAPRYAEIHREGYRDFLALLEEMVGAALAARQLPAGAEQCRQHAVALNALIDGLWLEGSLGHGPLGAGSLPRVALQAAEGMLGLPSDDLQQYLDLDVEASSDRN